MLESTMSPPIEVPKPVLPSQTRFWEWLGAAAGLLGATINALWPEHSLTAYMIWNLSSVALLVYGVRSKSYGIAAMSLGYTVLNSAGFFVRL